MFSGQPLDALARAAGVDEILTALMGVIPNALWVCSFDEERLSVVLKTRPDVTEILQRRYKGVRMRI